MWMRSVTSVCYVIWSMMSPWDRNSTCSLDPCLSRCFWGSRGVALDAFGARGRGPRYGCSRLEEH